MAGPDYIVDIAGVVRPQDQGGASADAPGNTPGREAQGQRLRGRPWLAVQWRCCQVYNRIYRNREGTSYQGHCPRCGRPVRVEVGPGGTASRFFEAS